MEYTTTVKSVPRTNLNKAAAVAEEPFVEDNLHSKSFYSCVFYCFALYILTY